MKIPLSENRQDNPSLESDDIFAKLRWGVNHFSARQSILCQFILENYQEVAFWSVEELSQHSGISPATVVRTVKSLGFTSYHSLLECFKKLIIDNKTTIFWEMESSLDKHPEKYPPLTWIARDNIQAIQNSVTPSLLLDINHAVDILQRARRIYLVALRSSRAALIFFYSIMSQTFDNLHMLHYGAEELFDHLIDLTEDDALLAVSLGGPHFTRTTIQAMEFARNNKVPTILVSNDLSAPAIEFADVRLLVSKTQHHYSIAPALTVLEALSVELGQRKKTKAIDKIHKLEPVLLEKGVTI